MMPRWSSWLRSWPFLAFLAYICVLLYVPLSRALTYVFRERDYYGGIGERWSLTPFFTYDFTTLVETTVRSALLCYAILSVTVIVASVLATTCELGLTQRARRWFIGLLVGLVAGDGLPKALLYRATFGLAPSPSSYFVLATAMLLPLATVSVSLGYRRLDPNLLTAAKDLGASKWVIARKVMLPSVLRSVKGAVAVCTALLFFNLVYAQVFLGGKTLVFATLVRLQYLELADWPAATISILAGIAILPIVFIASFVTVTAALTGRLKLR